MKRGEKDFPGKGQQVHRSERETSMVLGSVAEVRADEQAERARPRFELSRSGGEPTRALREAGVLQRREGQALGLLCLS